MTERMSNPVSRRIALTGLGAGGLGVAFAAAARPAAAQDTDAEMATHPVVGLWQFNGALDPAGPPAYQFEIYHADGTYISWSGLTAGAALGAWRPTGERTAEVVQIFIDTDPFPGGTEGPGTGTFRASMEVDDSNTTITYSAVTLDARDPFGTHLFPPGPFDIVPSTRVTVDWNPATGSTVAAPPAATPTS